MSGFDCVMTRAALFHVWADVFATVLLWGFLVVSWLIVLTRRDRRG